MRRFLSMGLATAMVFGLAFSGPHGALPGGAAVSMAASDDSAALENAIKTARALVEVPEDQKTFEYSLMSGEGDPVWYLYWSNEESGGTQVIIDSEGFISEYETYDWANENAGLGTTNLEAGEKTAEDFLEKLMPEKFSDFRLESKQSAGSRLSYSYRFYANDILIGYLSANTQVDKYSGKLVSYYFNGDKYQRDAVLAPVSDALISKEAAKAAFLEKIGLSLEYHTKTDYSEAKSSRSVYAAYSINRRNLYIDAENGNVLEQYFEAGDYYGMGGGSSSKTMDTAEEAEDGGTAVRLTPEEQSEVDKLEGVLSREAAVSAIAKAVPGISASDKVVSSRIYKDGFDKDKYMMNVRFENAYANIDAFTGELLSFYIYDYEMDNRGGYSEERARSVAEDFVKKQAGALFSELEYDEDTDWGIIIYNKQAADYTYEPYNYSFSFVRKVNGTRYSDNGYDVTVNRKDGQIVSFSKNWYGEVSFPDLSAAGGDSKAFDTFDTLGKFELMYMVSEKGKASIVYGFSGRIAPYVSLDGETLLNYNGEPYKTDERNLADYSDVEGHWYADIVNRLLDNGYFISDEDNAFNGGAKITQLDFLYYLYSPQRDWYNSVDDFYKYCVADVVTADEKNPSAELSRADAAKFIIRYLGLGKAGAVESVYRNDVFTDRTPEGYYGYAALAKGLGIMRGDETGRFNGSKVLTRAEAAQIIYNALNQ